MNRMNDTGPTMQPTPVRVSRVFSAPRETVFEAWSSADHVKRWFCPNGYSVPEAKVEMRVGGAFEVCMRSPEGVDHWTRGTFTEVLAPERLTIDHHVIDPCGGGTFVQRRHSGQIQRGPRGHADGGCANL